MAESKPAASAAKPAEAPKVQPDDAPNIESAPPEPPEENTDEADTADAPAGPRKATHHDKARKDAADNASAWQPPVGEDGTPLPSDGISGTDSYRRGNDEPADHEV